MKTICITLPEYPDETRRLMEHLATVGVEDPIFTHGINGPVFGLETAHTYEYDNPGTDFHIGSKQVGLFMSHYQAWNICAAMTDEFHFTILEADALFVEDWQPRLESCIDRAEKVMPGWDMMYIGSCHCKKPRKQLDRDLWTVKWPLCTHAYVLRPTGVQILLRTQRDVYGHIDCALMQRSLPQMKVLTVLPRIVDQVRWNDYSDAALYNGE